ncbi:MAG: UbiX family flavin prenyltransferase [Nitriliruptorales bacterium]
MAVVGGRRERSVRLVVGISGSSGAIYGVRLLEVLASTDDVETHAVITRGARATIAYETGRDPDEVAEHADRIYDDGNVAAALASGTFPTDGMVVAPCSMKTLAAIARSDADTLLVRAADVTLKERRRLVVVPRETPLHLGHLRHMVELTEMGAVVLPPVPGFYIRPTSIDELVDHTVTKILDQFGIDAGLIGRWTGLEDDG